MKRYSLAVDIGGTKILHAIVDLKKHQVIAKKKIKTQRGIRADECVHVIQESLQNLLIENKIKSNQVESLGIAVPGTIDAKSGLIGVAPNLGWRNEAFGQKARKYLPWPMYFANDVNAALWGEIRAAQQYKVNRFGLSGKEPNEIVYGIFCGTGIGGAMAIGNRIWTGAGHGAGEIGHMKVTGSENQCGCGEIGCLEAEIGKDGLVQFLANQRKKNPQSELLDFVKKDSARIKSSAVRKALQKKDPLAVALKNHYQHFLAMAITNVINLINPQQIILGGGILDAFDEQFFDDLYDLVARSNILKEWSYTEINRSRLGDFAGVMGAAFLFQQK